MPIYTEMTIEAAPNAQERQRLPAEMRGAKLMPVGPALSHVYTTDTLTLDVADIVQLQVLLVAYQIHPATIAELAALGPVGGANAKRWTIEGPLVSIPGDPGGGVNCTMALEVATSMTATPGAWRPYEAGRYRLRSVKARVTITRPSTSFQFRVARFTLLASRLSAPQRSRRVVAGVVDAVPSGMSRVVVRDFRVEAGATLLIEDNAYLKII